MTRPRRMILRVIAAGVALALSGSMLSAPSASAAASASVRPAVDADLGALGWVWPLERPRVTQPFVAPPHEYGPGHRGIDLAPVDSGSMPLRSPSDGVIAFAGQVAGRGILTIDHGGGLVTTLEPVVTMLQPGEPVSRGAEVATLSVGGHAAPGTVHFGVRLDGRYINPLLLLGGVPRAVLLPCCG